MFLVWRCLEPSHSFKVDVSMCLFHILRYSVGVLVGKSFDSSTAIGSSPAMSNL